MTPDPAAPRFRLLFSGAVGDDLRALRELARVRSVSARLLAAVRVIDASLCADPVSWGDPVRHLWSMDLVQYTRLYDELMVYYAVSVAERTVWLQGIVPVLGHPLTGPTG